MKFYQIDAFTNELFKGNSAGICPLERWIPDNIMQKIAFENNLSETAFYVKRGNSYDIRWFTPEEEIDLCGHATLAASHLLLNILKEEKDEIRFTSHLSGDLLVKRDGDYLVMDFPVREASPVSQLPLLSKALGISSYKLSRSRDLIVEVESEEIVRSLKPDFELLKKIDATVISVTAKSKDYDFIVRCFPPGCSIPEDPVTGSAYCSLSPYWAKILNKKETTALQASKRSGVIKTVVKDDRVLIYGQAKLYMIGEIFLD